MTEQNNQQPGRKAVATTENLLEVTDLRVAFETPAGRLEAVKGLSYELKASEALGIVGESGSGKSVGVLAIAGLLGRTTASVEGRAMLSGRNLLTASAAELREIRGTELGFVFQDSLASLNPVLTIGYQITEAIRVHRGTSKRNANKRAAELLDLVGIPEPGRRLGQYPHEFSGGMRQRVMIAAALSAEPDLLIADEPTTALDVTVQAQILELLRRLQSELGMSTILISHDLGVVAGLVDRIMVMYAGRAVEVGSAEELLSDPVHPYTQGLLRSIPRLDQRRGTNLEGIPGRLPDPTVQLVGCEFRERCPFAFDRCASERPPLAEVGPGRLSSCWLTTESSALEAKGVTQ